MTILWLKKFGEIYLVSNQAKNKIVVNCNFFLKKQLITENWLDVQLCGTAERAEQLAFGSQSER